jgi:hypothetical protein
LSPQDSARTRVVGWTAFIAGAATFLAVWLVVSRHGALYDTDAYFHLAAARLYTQEGLWSGLPWARFSVMYESFGDKELLFHLLLAPFTLFGPTGGRLALAILNGTAAFLIVRLAARVVGGWAGLLPLVLYLGSYTYLDRLIRLRPELLLLIWLVLAIDLAASRRFHGLAFVAFLLTWSHTGFPILLVLCAGWAWVDFLASGRWNFRPLLWSGAGIGLALLAHPQTPSHLRVFWVQNVQRWLMVLPDQGGEFLPNTLVSALRDDAAWFALLAAWLCVRATSREVWVPLAESALSRYLLVGAVVFGGLYGALARFATIFVPVATLAAIHIVRRPESGPLIRSRAVSAVVLSVVALALGARNPGRLNQTFTQSGLYLPEFEPLGKQFGRLIPAGGKVAASLSDTQFYIYYAPWARFLNVLDPAFMAANAPSEYAAFLSVFDGREPDVPLVVNSVLDSDYVALFGADGRTVGQRLAADPRVLRENRGMDALFEFRPGSNAPFALDWRIAPANVAALPPSAEWMPYPRATSERARALEGFVDLARTGGSTACQWLSHTLTVSPPTRVLYEFAPYGAGELWLDGRQIVVQPQGPRAILGQGLVAPLELRAAHEIRIRSCPVAGRNGFYLVERSRTPLTR